MAKVRTYEKNGDKEKLPASVDEALTDEFFSIIASIAMRLTKNSSPHDNIGKLSAEEGEKQ